MDLAFNRSDLQLTSLQYLQKTLIQKSLIVLSESQLNDLQHRIQRDLKVSANHQEQPPTLSKIDLILRHPPNSVDDQKRVTRTWQHTQIEIHSGTQNALIITLKYPELSLSTLESLHFLWQSPDWFVKSNTRSKRLRQAMTSKSAPGLIIDQKEIMPITFTPAEPEVIWRPPKDLSSLMKYSSSKTVDTSWWSRFKKYFWTSSSQKTHAELADTFQTLHKRIYHAFDQERDEEAYHALSLILSGEMLDQVFQSTYQALILRDQGGAKAKVTHVIPLKLESFNQADLPNQFSKDLNTKHNGQVYFRYHWRVVGKVDHWGHTHRRVNDYSAFYAMSSLNNEWRLTAVYPLSQKRRPELEGSL